MNNSALADIKLIWVRGLEFRGGSMGRSNKLSCLYANPPLSRLLSAAARLAIGVDALKILKPETLYGILPLSTAPFQI